MRPYTLFALLLFTVQQPSNPHIHSAESGISKGNAQGEANAEPRDLKRNPGITIQECKGCIGIEKCVGCFSEQKPRCECNQCDTYDPRKDTLYRAYLGATIFGVVVALLGIGAIYKQTKATKDAADATLRSASAAMRSVELQEKAQKQWVNLDGWNVLKTDTPRVFTVTFQIVNPTNVPLTLHFIHTTINEEESTQGSVNVLAPNNPYVNGTRCELSEADWDKYRASEQVSITITCQIFFADCFGIHWEQSFERRLSFGAYGGVSLTVLRNALRESGVPGESGSRDVELS